MSTEAAVARFPFVESLASAANGRLYPELYIMIRGFFGAMKAPWVRRGPASARWTASPAHPRFFSDLLFVAAYALPICSQFVCFYAEHVCVCVCVVYAYVYLHLHTGDGGGKTYIM